VHYLFQPIVRSRCVPQFHPLAFQFSLVSDWLCRILVYDLPLQDSLFCIFLAENHGIAFDVFDGAEFQLTSVC
jgi:hypothetical protein